ncbi:MAG TPA: penicillin-binding transpeptidase domain-containing protein, partial [Armatimonadota bacterium]|nr:penicillin-binding transpeptidase domain-containing protein [Armatimonadota bacterium]
LPAVGLVLYGCPWILGDRVLTADARAIGRGGERVSFDNPYLEQFRLRFSRGRIFSADDKLLAVSSPNAQELADIREVSPAVARVAERSRGNPEGARYYPLGPAAAQLIGWTPQGRFAAQEGSVEAAWDSLLRGYRPDQLPFYYRTRNNPIVRPPQPQDLQLTVRTDLQRFAAKRLSEAVKQWGGAGGALTVYDASTGAVLAAVTSPTFDPNGLTLERMQQYVTQNPRTQVLTNKALARDALYFPGSTFKIVTAGASLDEAITGSVTCRNGHNAEPITWEYGGKRWKRPAGKISDYHAGGHGSMNLRYDVDRAFTVSCNVFFGALAAELGPERLHRAMQNAELKRVPTADELAEHLPYDGFGQIDVKTSPLEMAMLAAAAGMARPEASDTAAARPHWVQAVVTKQNRREPEGIFGAPNRTPYRPFPEPVLQQLRRMMVRVVEDPSGTAHGAFYAGGAPRLPGITVGGKTGTAEFEKKGGKIGRHAWFVGF